MTLKVWIFRGYYGEFFSTGMDRLAEKIIDECDIDVTVDAYNAWIKHFNEIKDAEQVVLIGHSFGDLACYKIASMLRQKKFPLVVSFDYSPYYSGLIAHMPDGIVPENVEKAINFYQEVDPLIRGVKMERLDKSERYIKNVLTRYTHVEIDKVEELHKDVVKAIKAL
jgi:pimeloyl-ACP methyl ester carboxylesterase